MIVFGFTQPRLGNMSYDLQGIRDIGVTHPVMARQHAIFLDAQRSDRRVHKARNIADLLERGHKPARGGSLQGLVVDVKA
jgi:hypothetical protein